MTAAPVGVLAGRGHGARVRRTGAVAAIASLSALLLIGPPGRAGAATTGYDQITGIGQTDSAITVPWVKGLLDNTNQPITSSAGELASNTDRAGQTGQLSFMYDDFKNLKVTVSQTENISHQGVTVTWAGGAPTTRPGGDGLANFLQMMECYGDSSSGPDPTQCLYGSPGLLTTNVVQTISHRDGQLCAAGSAPDPSNPAPPASGGNPSSGCDPNEPGTGQYSHLPPCTGSSCSGPAQSFFVPFVPVDGSAPAYAQQGTNGYDQYFNQFSTDEVQEAVTGPDGTGQQQFETLTSTEAPALGCGAQESGGQTRGCWLVIVPRGQYEPNGFKLTSTSTPADTINSTPLSASNWAMRIQIHLGFAPVQAFCPIGTQESETLGTQIASRAVVSWQLALNKAANCTRIFGYSAVPEATTTQQLCTPGSGIGLAFTTIPIGSEAVRAGSNPQCSPGVLYAPVAVSALGFGFNINTTAAGYVTTPMKLTPTLLAHALTQSYRFDLPDFVTADVNHPGPAWSQANPQNITQDPLFEKLNSAIGFFGGTVAPLLTEDHSALNQQAWQWIQADPTAAAWLDGTPEPSGGVTVDPDYQTLNLGKTLIDSFPRAYAACLDAGLSHPLDPTEKPKEEIKCSLDVLPYANDYASAATLVLEGNLQTTNGWSETATGPDGTGGWWGKPGIQPIGSIWMWGIADTPDLAAFGLIPAELCDDAGSNCVGPSTASLTAALATAKPDSSGLLRVNPASVGAGSYPLVSVTYAAVPTNQDAAALKAYADLIEYAAGPGQQPGAEAGDLPPGYLPMPANLKTQALAVVAELRADASGASPTPSGSSGTSVTAGSGTSPQLGGSLSPGQSASPQPYNIRPPGAELTSSTTPRQPVGPIRWVLLAVVIVGAACAVGGTLLRTARVPRWLNRARL